ncbi:unnamed protein product, partial [Cuscuta epithymum]
MLDNIMEISQRDFQFVASGYNLKLLKQNAEVHMLDSPLFAEVGPVFSGLEEEAMGLQCLLEEPKCCGIDEVLHSSFTEDSNTVEQVCSSITENDSLFYPLGKCERVPWEGNSDFVACENYLLGIMLDENAQNLHVIMNNEVHGGKTNFDHSSVDFDGSCGASDEVLRESIPTTENTGEEISPTADEVLRVSIPTNENIGVVISPTADEDLLRASTPYSSIFKFKRKQRVKRVNMKRKVSTFDSFQSLCFMLGRNSELDMRKSEISKLLPKGNILHDGWSKPKAFRNNHFRSCNRIPLHLHCVEDESIRVEGHKRVNGRNKRRDRYSNVSGNSLFESEEDDDTYSVGESAEATDESENKQKKTTRINIKQKRRNHNFWSITEVTNLVEGVSKFGVGKWVDIKRFFFHASPHRSPSDLKDKWRNLMRA